MVSEFHQLSEKISRLAEMAQLLRRENAELRMELATRRSENDDLLRRIEEAYRRVEALLEKLPGAPGEPADASEEKQEAA
ncbi:hypothetical protein SAMN06265795_11131 [Noviherbaspirillum humi]|uniref:Cell division protein ZapB n=1 Tax=Noviherbaspirillum humi TaxID=1688639 RepID=A0A239IYE7_9BURK|nr:DUF904 domain-containing protein [Noviherbaspirillum humi]SNS98651.1 hypothetical protein SAMN06265795_11131 [Noviherbaspirillum humi]